MDVGQHAIYCLLRQGGEASETPYVAADGDEASQPLFDALKAGEFGPVAPYAAPVASLADMGARARAAVAAAASLVVAQVMPDAAHQAAFQNAASILNGNGRAPPTSGPLASAFTALAASYGLSASAFAGVVLGAQAASMILTAASATFNAAASAATDAGGIATALSVFETALAAVMTEINAVLPIPITAPASIVIAGVNG